MPNVFLKHTSRFHLQTRIPYITPHLPQPPPLPENPPIPPRPHPLALTLHLTRRMRKRHCNWHIHACRQLHRHHRTRRCTDQASGKTLTQILTSKPLTPSTAIHHWSKLITLFQQIYKPLNSSHQRDNLAVAAAEKDVESVCLLLQAGADVNEQR